MKKKLKFTLLLLLTATISFAQQTGTKTDTSKVAKKENPGSIFKCRNCKKGWDSGKEAATCESSHSKEVVATNTASRAVTFGVSTYKCDCCNDKNSIHTYCCRYNVLSASLSVNAKMPVLSNKTIPPPLDWDTLVPETVPHYKVLTGLNSGLLQMTSLTELEKILSTNIKLGYKISNALIRKLKDNKLVLVILLENKTTKNVESILAPLIQSENGYLSISEIGIVKINEVSKVEQIQISTKSLSHNYIGHVTLLR